MPDFFIQKNALETSRTIFFHTLDMHCHISSNRPFPKKYKIYAYFDRTALQNASRKSATEGITLISAF